MCDSKGVYVMKKMMKRIMLAGLACVAGAAILTGCGGGVMRDVFAGSPPYIFVKHFYATASLLGAVACLLLWNIGQMPAMLIGAAVTLMLRLLAAHYRWSLPKAK